MTRRLLLCCAVLFTGCASRVPSTPPSQSSSPDSVRIVRDNFGVPHVYADSLYGLYFGYGFAIGQDRLFQMEMARRSTQGLVAEVLGPEFLDYDRSTRTLFSPRSIRTQLAALETEDRDIFDGYAAGMNRWIDRINSQPETLLPKQFMDLGFRPARWTAYDVAMVFIGTMNNRYGDFNTELENAAILGELQNLHGIAAGQALFDLLNPRFTELAPTTIPSEDWSVSAFDSLAQAGTRQEVMTIVQSQPTLPPTGFSNVYLLGKEKTLDGSAILVNGPQFGWFNPAYVYSIGLHGAGIDVAGNTPFGYPMIMFGHNRHISWGSTWGASDIVDLFAEQLNPENPAEYLYQGSYQPFESRTEVIRVAGAESVTFEAQRSVHGPVIRVDQDNGVAYAKRRSWDGIELDTLLAWLRATWAEDWQSWKNEAERSAINVNMYFADTRGNIGYFHGGHFPQRVPGHDNRLPARGDGSMDWRGRQPVSQANPHVLNPTGHVLANWNNKPGQGVMNPDFFFYSWSQADRVDFLHQALTSMEQVTPDEAWELLRSSAYADLYAPYFVPALVQLTADSANPQLRRAGKLLASWNQQSVDLDADGYYDQQATGLFRRFIGVLIEQVLKDNLGAAYGYFSTTGYPTATAPTGAGTNLPAGLKAIVEVMNGRSNFDLFDGNSVDQVLLTALERTISEDGFSPLAVAPRPFLTRNFLGVPQADDSELMMAPIEQNRGTENNMIVLRPGAIEGWEVTPPGQSGFVAPDGQTSNHYSNQFDLYHQFGRKRIWFYAADVERNKHSEIRVTAERNTLARP